MHINQVPLFVILNFNGNQKQNVLRKNLSIYKNYELMRTICLLKAHQYNNNR